VVYYDDKDLSNVALQYEKECPNVDIIINDIIQISYEKTIKKLNTELMAGKGTDIINGYFPINDRKEKGMLVNLKEFINRDKSFDIKDYNENIINLSKAEYGFYSLSVDKVRVDSKDNIHALKLNGEIEIYDENLNKTKVLNEKQYKDIAKDEKDNLIALCLDWEKSTIGYIEIKNYKTKWEKEHQYSQVPNIIFYNLSNKTLYGLVNGIIMQYDSEGNPVKELLYCTKLE